jgi:hypothetical protein
MMLNKKYATNAADVTKGDKTNDELKAELKTIT